MTSRTLVEEVATRLVATHRPAVALTGAGVSKASGLPTFREEGGIWDRYDPYEYGHVSALHRAPEKVWELMREFYRARSSARPNPAHRALSALEELGLVRSVITQNADGLHQEAGSQNVIELHGSTRSLTCLDCGGHHDRDEVAEQIADGVPRCRDCDGVLRPAGVFFGEELPREALLRAWTEVQDCRLLLVVGTSGEVYPAAALPDRAREHGAEIVEINPDPVLAADLRLPRPGEEVLPALLAAVRDRLATTGKGEDDAEAT